MRINTALLAGVLTVCAAICAAGLSAGQASRPVEGMLALESFGLTMPAPLGYRRAAERMQWVCCKYEVADAKGVVIQVIDVQIAKVPAGQTPMDVAKGMAGETGAVNAVKWGGLDAAEVRGDPKSAKENWYRARQVATEHAGYSYLMTYATEPGREDYAAFDRIKAETVWMERKPVGEAIHARGGVIPLGAGLVGDLPDPFRIDSKSSKPGKAVYVATDFSTGKSAVTVSHVASGAGESYKSLAEAQEAMARQIKSAEPAVWRTVAGGKAALSSLVVSPEIGLCQGVVAEGKGGNMELFLFGYLPTAGDPAKASEAARIMAESLRARP